MNHNLKTPCAQCPFREDVKGFITAGRAKDICESLLNGQSFPCHKTLKQEEDGLVETSKSEHCAGAMIFLEKQGAPNQMMRIAERLRMYSPKQLDMKAPVFESTLRMILHMKASVRRS